jgi:hypothetical protein
MVVISKGMVVASALIAFGFVVVDDMARGVTASGPALAQSREAASDALVVQHGTLRQRAAAALQTLSEKQEDARTPAEPAERPACGNQSWPYYSNNCLVGIDGAEPRPVIRVVRTDLQLAGQVVAVRFQ